MILKLVMQHRKLKLYRSYINNDPRLTLIYFTTRLHLVVFEFQLQNLLQSHVMGKTFSKLPNGQKIYVYKIILTLPGLFDPAPALQKCRYDHYFQTSSSLKPIGLSKPNFMWSLLGNEGGGGIFF